MRLIEFDTTVIEQECSDIYSVRNGLTLYRGLTDEDLKATKTQFVGTIRKDRQPRDSNQYQREIFDLYMELEGWEFRKANTLSVTNHKYIATSYGGYVFRIYPFDGASYLYSPVIRDFFDLPQWADDRIGDLELQGTTLTASAFLKEYINEIRDRFQFKRTTDPKDLTYAAGEILVFGTKYIGVRDE